MAISFEKAVLQQLASHPALTITDLVKLAYQSGMGSAHLQMAGGCMAAQLESEWDAVMGQKAKEPLLQDISGGYARLDLRAWQEKGLPLWAVKRLFALAQSLPNGMERLLAGLDELLSMTAQGRLPFAMEHVESELNAYRAAGCPVISHSQAYRRAYDPAYRLVPALAVDYQPLIEAIIMAKEQGKRLLVAIDGNSGGGKSTLGAFLKDLTGCNLFHMDDFFLPEDRRTPKRLCQPGGNVDYERFAQSVLRPLETGAAFSYRPYSCKKGKLQDPVQVVPCAINVIEGAYSLHPDMKGKYDLTVFLKIGSEAQSQRILSRSGPVLHKRFMEEWVPMENRYFTHFQIEDSCDLVFENTDETT